MNINLQQVVDDLNTLNPNDIGSWPRYLYVVFSVVLAVVVAGAGTWFVILPDQEVLEAERRKEQTLFDDFEKKQRKVSSLDAYKAQLAEMEKTFGDMLKVLPAKSEVANLLNDISQTRVASSLEEELFKPQADVPKDFYVEIPNQIIVIGGYHEMGSFVSGVSALPRIVTIEDVDVRPMTAKAGGAKSKSSEPATGAEGVLLRMQAVAKTYRYMDPEEVAAAAAAAAAATKKGAGGGKGPPKPAGGGAKP